MSTARIEIDESSPGPFAPTAAAPRSRAGWIGLALILLFLLFAFARSINLPWAEEDNYYGALYSQAAHNNLRAGLGVTAGVPATLYFGPLPIPASGYYVHHPTLLPLLVTGAFAIFGEHEWAARLVPIFCSLASVSLLWLLVFHAAGPRAATLSALVFAFMPMELHYGDVVNFEPCGFLPMLAALWGLQQWLATAKRRWAWLAAVSCLLALWVDWPGYLFVLCLAGWLVFQPGRRWLAWLLLGIAAVSGTLFLLQIRWVNPSAWSDLWTALLMRVGNGQHTGSGLDAASGPHFTTAEWCSTVGGDLLGNFQPLPLALALVGAGIIIARWRVAPGRRALGALALPLLITGVLYVVIFRNESFIHDFAPFYLIGPIALAAGVALDAAWESVARQTRPLRFGVRAGLIALLAVLATLGWKQSQAMRTPYVILDGDAPEPADLIPVLGRGLHDAFGPDTTILLNFDPYGSALPYYIQRAILNNLNTDDDWKDWMDEESPVGGAIWLGGPGAAGILAALPPNEVKRVEIDGIAFALWIPKNARAEAK
jgi:4-amino-4-deoxy-L-arabinose transferase-like glycosyltransferase